jgi:hypothetical protein
MPRAEVDGTEVCAPPATEIGNLHNFYSYTEKTRRSLTSEKSNQRQQKGHDSESPQP